MKNWDISDNSKSSRSEHFPKKKTRHVFVPVNWPAHNSGRAPTLRNQRGASFTLHLSFQFFEFHYGAKTSIVRHNWIWTLKKKKSYTVRNLPSGTGTAVMVMSPPLIGTFPLYQMMLAAGLAILTVHSSLRDSFCLISILSFGWLVICTDCGGAATEKRKRHSLERAAWEDGYKFFVRSKVLRRHTPAQNLHDRIAGDELASSSTRRFKLFGGEACA